MGHAPVWKARAQSDTLPEEVEPVQLKEEMCFFSLVLARPWCVVIDIIYMCICMCAIFAMFDLLARLFDDIIDT